MRNIIKDIAWIIANNFVYYKMKHFVYKLLNSQGEVEYVGESKNPQKRLYHHTKFKPRPNQSYGKFYGRTDLSVVVCSEHDSKSKAFFAQNELQKQYGFIPDSEILSKSLKGHTPWNKGITHSDETKQKLKELAILQHSKKRNSSTI